MAKRAHAYPQANPVAADLVDVGVVRAPATLTVGEALRLLRKRDARALAAGEHAVLREDLSRANVLGLDDLPAAALARALPCVDVRAGEVTVRRLLAAGVPLVMVRGRQGPVGAVASPGRAGEIAASAAGRVGRGLPAETRTLLETVGRLAALEGARAFLVGGMVRDLWRATPVTRRDLDIVVEGDGLAVARRLARELGGSVVEHGRFLTASVEAPRVGRIDVATARAERYQAPAALPRVIPALIDEDLRRRDFTVNAMAIELGSGGFGLLDPLGGREDLARGRLRILHPLSYVEDPTRMFRAARYAARLGLVQDRATVRAQALALRLAPYPLLSGQRITNELARILAEPSAVAALRRLGSGGVLRLIDSRYRFGRVAGCRVEELPAALAWTRARDVEASPVELAVLTLVADQPPGVIASALIRLAFAGEPLVRRRRALAAAPELATRLAAASAPSARARELRPCSGLELAWLWLTGGPVVRSAVEWYVGLDRTPIGLTGDEVMALGVPRGPDVARVLAELRDARLDGTLQNRATEIEHVRRWLQKGG